LLELVTKGGRDGGREGGGEGMKEGGRRGGRKEGGRDLQWGCSFSQTCSSLSPREGRRPFASSLMLARRFSIRFFTLGGGREGRRIN